MSEVEGETTDVESVVTEKSNTESELSSNYGKLKHSDSLLLLTQVSLGVCCVAEISPNFTNYTLFRHMMGNLMSDCQELVYKGFVPVPEDIEELGDNSPLARYSNSSK